MKSIKELNKYCNANNKRIVVCRGKLKGLINNESNLKANCTKEVLK